MRSYCSYGSQMETNREANEQMARIHQHPRYAKFQSTIKNLQLLVGHLKGKLKEHFRSLDKCYEEEMK